MKKKAFIWRGNLYLLQHFSAVFAVICLLILFMNSFLSFEYMSGNQVYSNMHFINPLDSTGDFGESDIFTELFERSIKDVIRYAAIKGQFEVDGRFDGTKIIDITVNANRKNRISGEEHQSIPANYYLEDLIKWGKYGEAYTEVYFESIWQAVSYFNESVLDNYMYVTDIYNKEGFHLRYDGNRYYYIDTNGIYIPVYKGAASGCTVLSGGEGASVSFSENGINEDIETDGINEEPVTLFPQAAPSMLDMIVSTAFYYEISINSSSDDYILESDETIPGVIVNMLDERYTTVRDSTIGELSSCWKDYFTLVENLIYYIDSLYYNYNQYQIYWREYNNSNLKFCISMMKGDEKVFIGNHQEDLNEKSNIDEYFRTQFDKYIIYCPGEMLFVTNTKIQEQSIFDVINNYSYAYPDNTRIWIGVNTSDFVAKDKFSKAAAVYDRFMPRVWLYIVQAVLGILGWLAGLIYLCCVTGKRRREDGTEYTHLYWFDKIPTEIELILAGGVGIAYLFGLYMNFAVLKGNMAEIIESKPIGIYVDAALQTLLLSLLITLFLYSFVRRWKAGNFWKNSITRYLGTKLWKAVKYILLQLRMIIIFVYDNGRAMTRVVLPFLILVFLNLLAGVFFYRYLYAGLSYGKYVFSLSMRSLIVCIILLFIGVVDVGVLVVLLWNQVNRNKIVDGINQICKGDMTYQIDLKSMHGENRMLATAVNNIGDSIRTAVETSMKDEKLKADLITNVSHDIKTPLTSIINYVDLLKREHVEEEPIKGYIAVLDAKSQRLKQLTDDLVEASKISSGNITLIMNRINLTELLNQTVGEFEEKLAQKGLQVVVGYEKKPVCIMADSRRIWRVIENLFDNVYKYAMENTRVYLDMTVKDKQVEVFIKNISAQPLNIQADELTERFIRGDVSRSTEGSGLGLSIAKSLTIAQGGDFKIYLDGDLFKVTILFPVAEES